MGKQVPLEELRHKRFQSIWCAKDAKETARLVKRDYVIRHNIEQFCKARGIDHVRTIIHGAKDCKVDLYALRVGVLVGKNKENINLLRKKISKASRWHRIEEVKDLKITSLGIQNQELDPDCIAIKVACDLERGKSFNASMKTHMQEATRFGATGIAITCSGRLNGNEIARTEPRKIGKVPKKTIRANTFYGFRHAYTKSGTCGVKVRINLSSKLSANKTVENPVKQKHFGSKKHFRIGEREVVA